MRNQGYSLITSALILLLWAASVFAQPHLPPFDPATVPPAPEYADPANWLARPEHPGPHPVDVFWVYPTILFDGEHWLMDPQDRSLRMAAARTLTEQASVFEGQANIYAPVYRQMNIACLGLSEEVMNRTLAYGLDDVWRAFQYYLEHENNGRPFILAGHSQGSDILTILAIRHWGTLGGAEKRLVAAYLIGWSITEDDLQANPALTLCARSDQVNCFLSYNTVAPGRQSAAPTIRKGAVAVNPLSWRLDEGLVPASENLGARFFKDDGSSTFLPQYTSAQVVDSGLVVRPKDASWLQVKGGVFPEGIYHKFDYSIFYENLKRNAAERIAAFLKP